MEAARVLVAFYEVLMECYVVVDIAHMLSIRLRPSTMYSSADLCLTRRRVTFMRCCTYPWHWHETLVNAPELLEETMTTYLRHDRQQLCGFSMF